MADLLDVRFIVVHIQASSCDLATFKCLNQSFFVHHWTTTCVDQKDTLLHLSELIMRDHICRRFIERTVQCEHVALSQKLV